MRCRFVVTLTFATLVASAGEGRGLTAATPDASPLSRSEILLAPGDVLEFDILDDDDPVRQLTVGSDGHVQVPLLGAVEVADLSVNAATERIRARLVERRIMVSPNIGLSVVSYRPVYVIGDVRSPGSFPFRLNLTVEQAVGLAGGTSIGLGSAEANALGAAKAQGDMATVDADLTREGILAARLVALLAGRNAVEPEDVPAAARPFLADFPTLAKIADRILEQELSGHRTQRRLIDDAVAEATRELATLDEMVENQKKAVKFSQDDAKRTNVLLKGGLTRASEVSRIERQLAADEGRLLAIYSQISQLRRTVTELKRERARLDDTRQKDALVQLQEQHVRIQRLLTTRRTLEDQMLLSSGLARDAARVEAGTTVEYRIRRRLDGRIVNVPADPLTPVLPGDVVAAAMRRPASAPVAAAVAAGIPTRQSP